jgi:hypothetical protein
MLAMDYGQFSVAGAPDDDDENRLLHRVFAAPPSGGTGRTVLVLNPHQNNHDMLVEIETWDARPGNDRNDWQQVSEDLLAHDGGLPAPKRWRMPGHGMPPAR